MAVILRGEVDGVPKRVVSLRPPSPPWVPPWAGHWFPPSVVASSVTWGAVGEAGVPPMSQARGRPPRQQPMSATTTHPILIKGSKQPAGESEVLGVCKHDHFCPSCPVRQLSAFASSTASGSMPLAATAPLADMWRLGQKTDTKSKFTRSSRHVMLNVFTDYHNLSSSPLYIEQIAYLAASRPPFFSAGRRLADLRCKPAKGATARKNDVATPPGLQPSRQFVQFKWWAGRGLLGRRG